MGKWRATAALLFNHITSKTSNSLKPNLCSRLHKTTHHLYPLNNAVNTFGLYRSFSAIPSRVSVYSNEIDYESHDLASIYDFGPKEDEDVGKISAIAYFLCTKSVSSSGFCLISLNFQSS